MVESTFFNDVISVLFPVLLTASLSLLAYFWIRREGHKKNYSVLWKPSKAIKPSHLLAERPFSKYYEKRDSDRIISQVLQKHHNVFILGPPLAGKSRAIYEALKNNSESFEILMPRCREIIPDSFILPIKGRFWKKGIVIIDDFQRYIEQPGFEYLFREVVNSGFTIIASSRTKNEFKSVRNWMATNGFHFESIFRNNIVEISMADQHLGEKVAQQNQISWNIVRNQFNGTIGSLFMKLEEMERRFNNATANEKQILRSIQKLYICGAFEENGTFPITWIRKIAVLSDEEWQQVTEALQNQEFFQRIKDAIKIEPVYLEQVIIPFPEIQVKDLFTEISQQFLDDPHVLLKISGRALYSAYSYDKQIVWSMRCVISINNRILENYRHTLNSYEIGRLQNQLGIAYDTLAKFEDHANNCKLAIESYNKALMIYTVNKFPTEYASVQTNIGIAYSVLSDIENTVDNCSQAINSYKQAHRIFTIGKFPYLFAITNMNLGVAYAKLAKIENTLENGILSINAYNEGLKVLTFDRYPNEYADIQNNLGNTLRDLARFENDANRCKNAIDAFNETLKVHTKDRFPLNYGDTKNNLGNAYLILAGIERKREYCKKGITSYLDALEVRTQDEFPYYYGETQNNLGLAFALIAAFDFNDKILRNASCKAAIDAFKESLKIFTFDKYPLRYEQIKNKCDATREFCKSGKV